MILLFSTSSPLASAALFSAEGDLIWAESRLAPRQASAACLDMISQVELAQVKIFAADVGPGSFTGVKVGVTLAKTLAWAAQASCMGVSAFDLISRSEPACIAIRRGVVLRRDPGQDARQVEDDEAQSVQGYGVDGAIEKHPEAARAAGWIAELKTVTPYELSPEYLIEPSISQPKRPLILRGPDA